MKNQVAYMQGAFLFGYVLYYLIKCICRELSHPLQVPVILPSKALHWSSENRMINYDQLFCKHCLFVGNAPTDQAACRYQTSQSVWGHSPKIKPLFHVWYWTLLTPVHWCSHLFLNVHNTDLEATWEKTREVCATFMFNSYRLTIYLYRLQGYPPF